jgi:hypothetical protein
VSEIGKYLPAVSQEVKFWFFYHIEIRFFDYKFRGRAFD